MATMKGVDEAFLGVGDKPGLEIWCIVNNNLVPITKSSHGKFFSGNCYIILSTVELKSGLRRHDIHYWLGEDAKEEDCVLASDNAVELDAALGSHTVQYREFQGEETDKFLSYFKPCIIPIEGSFASLTRSTGEQSYRISMFSCQGDHVAHVREVSFSRSSLNHNAVFIVDTQPKIFLFSGCNSSMQTRARALDIIQHIRENQHGGRCEIATIEDGKLVGDSDAGEFWNLFGGYAPIPRDTPNVTQRDSTVLSQKLFWINKGRLVPVEMTSLDRQVLSSDRCYMLDSDAEIFLWMGMTTLVSERKSSITALEDYVHSQGRSSDTRTTIQTEGHETAEFKSRFHHWPQNVAPKLYEEGREKVAAIFKHQGYDVTEIPEDKPRQLIDCNGSLKVWLVDRGGVTLLCAEEQEKLYSGDCYIVRYNYTEGGKDYHLFYAWLGKKSTKEDRFVAASLMSSMVDSVKGHPIMAQVFEGREPDLFFLMFKSLIIFMGGRSTAYKNSMLQTGARNETYQKDGAALFRVQGLQHNCVQAIQVGLVASSLNSSYCYILQDGDSFFTWLGSLSSPSDHDLLDRMLDKLSPLKQSLLVREGSESDLFWKTLGGKADYSKEKHIRGWPADPHLFTCAFEQGAYKGKEVFNFTQDDLTTEEALILDCKEEIYIWIGLHTDITSKEQALNLGKMFLEADILREGRSTETTIYVITEGDEPTFFTCFFDWDRSKQSMHGSSFERKLAILKGLSPKLETPNKSLRKSFRRLSSDSTPDHPIRRTFSSEKFARERSPASTVSSTFQSPKSHSSSTPTTVARQLFPPSLRSHESSPVSRMKSTHISPAKLSKDGLLGSPLVHDKLNSDPAGIQMMIVRDREESHTDEKLEKFSCEHLKVPSGMSVARTGVKEGSLWGEEFQQKVGMTKDEFYKLPKWRQNKLKFSHNLF